jgi:hypothetical protein
VLERAIRLDPAFDVATRLARFGLSRREDPASVLAGLAKAGLNASL